MKREREYQKEGKMKRIDKGRKQRSIQTRRAVTQCFQQTTLLALYTLKIRQSSNDGKKEILHQRRN
jgi:hypothetical protein